MGMFPHTVTVYNVSTEIDKTTLAETTTSYITILRGVLLDASKAVNARTIGPEGADAVNLYIPFNVQAVDGLTGAAKTYAGPMEFDKAEDKAGLWTMSLDGEGAADSFFVKGEAIEPSLTFEGIAFKYDHVYNITKVDEKDFGGLQHWEVGGA